MTQKLLIVIIAAFFNATYLESIYNFISGEQDIYIYGKITMEDDKVYKGQIRWGNEEAFWFDFFNSSKPTNKNVDYLSKDQLDGLTSDRNDGPKQLWNWNWSKPDQRHTHAFSCQFGDIRAIEMGRGEKVVLEFKDGKKLDLKGGSNDIETFVQIVDSEFGHIKLDWDRIKRVDFLKAGASFESYYGTPLYGTVKTESGNSFTGYVQWDHDERMSKDELNGENEDGKVDLEFGKISKIQKERRSSLITTKSGRTFSLRGTNDVNQENRGIIVNITGQGRVDIPWKEFAEVEFTQAKTGIIDYDRFDGQKELSGSVTTNDGQNYNGRIIFDLDEELQLEILNGQKDHIEYFIPFSIVKSIAPQGKDNTKITLSSGESLVLEDSVDVNEENDGILVFANESKDPIYIEWKNIKTIDF